VFLALTVVVGADPAPAALAPGTRAPLSTRGLEQQVTVRTADRFDVSPALRDIKPAKPLGRGTGTTRPWADRPLPRTGKPSGPHAPDPVLQTSRGKGDAAPSLPGPTVNFDGMNVNTADPDFLFILPPDPNGDVGPNHYVQMVNSAFTVYSKTGTPLFGPAQINSLWSGFGGKCQTNNDGDPIVQYDQLADRWLLSQFAVTDNNGNFQAPFYQCIAISQTPDPTGAYFRYAFHMGDQYITDYPHIGVWPDAYYMSTNLFDHDNGDAFAGAGSTAFERAKMLAGDPGARMVDIRTLGGHYGGQLPSDLDGSTVPPAGSPDYFVEADDSGLDPFFPVDEISVFEFHVDWVNTANSTFSLASTIPTAQFDADVCLTTDPEHLAQCIPQEGTAFRLDAISDRIMYRLAYRNFGDHEALTFNHTVDIDGTDHAGIRWWELRKSPSASTDWTSVYQEGTYAGDNPSLDIDHRWMGSAAMDNSGDLALGYSLSGVDRFPSLGYVGRKPTDPLGTLPQGEVVMFGGGGSQNFPIGRWGDYSSLSVDPADGCTFWYTNEYYAAVPDPTLNGAQWRTRIGAFKFPQCGAGSGADVSATITDSPDPVIVGQKLTYHVTVTNNGPDSAANVTLTDALPATTSLVSVSPGSPTCTGTTVITCGLGTMSAGANFAVDIVVNTSQTGTLNDTASVSTTSTDPNPANNSATAATTVKPLPSIVFGPATVVDAQRTEGEPLNFIDLNGNYWESGPWGTSTQNSFVHRSVDGGNQFNIVSPVGLRPDPGNGGGDTDIVVDDQGFAYFSDLELANVSVSVSNDNGNIWRKQDDATPFGAAVDRQWMAIDNGSNLSPGAAGAADNTVFITVRQLPTTISQIYSSPGSTGPTDPIGGQVFSDAETLPNTTALGAPCGELHFDPVNRNLFLPCVNPSGNAVNILKAHVPVGQRTGLAFSLVTAPVSPGGAPDNFFPIVSTDTAGNLYVTWTDGNDFHVYYSWATTTNTGTVGTFSAPKRIDSAPANTNVFHWADAGAPGVLAIGWYGQESNTSPSAMTSWFADRNAATQYPWYGYVAEVTSANTSTPSIVQTRFTEKPMHYGEICLDGTLCAADPNSDRTMADFMTLHIDRSADPSRNGAIRIVYDDTTNQHNGASLFEARQLQGPNAMGGPPLNNPIPANPMADPTGDAQSPHYSPTGTGASLDQYDLTGVKLSQPDPNTLRVEMSIKDVASFAPPPGKTNGVWLTRFQARSTGQLGEDSYRILYVGAESVNGAQPTFFAGSGSAVDANGVPGNGCVTSTPKLCKIVQYPAEVTSGVTGTIIQGDENSPSDTIRIDVPLQGGFGAGRPITTSEGLYNVTALTFGRNDATADLYADIDATRSFDYPLGFIGGTVTNDTNGNGSVDGGEPGLQNVTVFADLNANGRPDSGEPATTTSSAGGYALSGLAGGTYTVDYVVPAGFTNTGLKPRTVALGSGQTVTGQNFLAQQRNGAITGTVINDTDGDGQADPGETGLPLVAVTLSPGGTAVTAPDGSYSFTGLAAGTYSVDYAVPSGYVNTGARPLSVTLSAGQVATGRNFFAQPHAADLSVTNTDAPDPVHIGQNLTYTVKVTNAGPASATSVTLTDQLAKSAGFGSASTTQGSCTYKPSKNMVTCSLGTIAPGATVIVTIGVKPSSKGTISATATATSTTSDTNTANNTATATTKVTP
jgi:uncharacterized repeat protein (TIGR01451 family)